MTENVKHVEVLRERLRKVRRLIEEYALVNEDARVLELRHEESATFAAIDALQREAAGGGEVLWQCRMIAPDGHAGSWRNMGVGEERVTAPDGFRYEYRQFLLSPRPTGTEDVAETIIRDVCELDPADTDHPDTVSVKVHHLRQIIKRALATPASAEPCYCRRCHPTLGDPNATPPKAAPCQPTEARGGGEAEPVSIFCELCPTEFHGDEELAANSHWTQNWDGWTCASHTHPTPAALDAEMAQLMKFYGVDSLVELARSQAEHVTRLQAKLAPPVDHFPRNPRAG